MSGEPKTNPRTPSAQHVLGLAVCPACDGRKSDPTCDYCEGAGRVTLARHHAYIGLAPITERSPPAENEDDRAVLVDGNKGERGP